MVPTVCVFFVISLAGPQSCWFMAVSTLAAKQFQASSISASISLPEDLHIYVALLTRIVVM